MIIVIMLVAAAIIGILFLAERRFPSWADPVVREREPQFTTAPSRQTAISKRRPVALPPVKGEPLQPGGPSPHQPQAPPVFRLPSRRREPMRKRYLVRFVLFLALAALLPSIREAFRRRPT
jgi:hypothetical protein